MTDNTKDALRMALGWSNDSEWKAQALAEFFHSTYERLAPQFGYETRTETRRFDPESANGKLMIAVCAEVLVALTSPDPKEAAQDERKMFVQWVSTVGDGVFAGKFLNLMWEAWQARSALSAQFVREQALPPEVIAWHQAEQARIDAIHRYNDRLTFVRMYLPVGTSVDPEYQAMEDAGRKARSLIKPMFDAIRALSSQPAQKEAGNG
jgi:hypothetical protein